MTTEEKLAKLRERYPDWRIDVTDLCEGSALCVGTMSPQRWEASATWYALGPNGSLEETEIARRCKTQEAALDALAEALAKLEGVTIPRKVALALALVSAGRWGRMWGLQRLMAWWEDRDDDWGDHVFAALGTTEDEVFAEMKD